jgi:hypothetical protein
MQIWSRRFSLSTSHGPSRGSRGFSHALYVLAVCAFHPVHSSMDSPEGLNDHNCKTKTFWWKWGHFMSSIDTRFDDDCGKNFTFIAITPYPSAYLIRVSLLFWDAVIEENVSGITNSIMRGLSSVYIFISSNYQCCTRCGSLAWIQDSTYTGAIFCCQSADSTNSLL